MTGTVERHIDLNFEKAKRLIMLLEERLLKFINYSLIVKTMDNVKNRTEFKLTTKRKTIKCFSRLTFKDICVCDGLR